MVWPRYPEAKSSLLIDENIDFTDLLTDDKRKKIIENHLFVQTLQILVPKCVDGGDILETIAPNVSRLIKNNNEALNDDFLYILAKKVPIHFLCHPIFIENYVKKGKIYAVSTETCIQSMDCVSVDPSGLLQLSILERTYFRLGIPGQKSTMYRKKNIYPKYCIKIDLKSRLCGKTDSNYFQRLFKLLRNSNLKFNLLLKWEPDSEDVSPLSLVKFFKFMKANPGEDGAHYLDVNDSALLDISLCSPKSRAFKNYAVNVPKEMNFSLDSEKVESQQEFELIDWIGAQFCEVNCNEDNIDAEVSSLIFRLEECDNLPIVNCFEVSGFFTPKDVKTVLREFQSILSSPEIPFTVVIANGFENSLVSWKGKNNEHGKRLSGENLTGIIMKKDNKCHIWRSADEFDFGIEKL